MRGNGIPIVWIEEQIKKNPGHLAATWRRLLDMWNYDVLHGDKNGERKTEEGFIRLHKDLSALDMFWRNE